MVQSSKGTSNPLLETYDIIAKRISVKNPQANAVLERIHQVVGDMLRSKDLENYDFQSENPWADILSSVVCAIYKEHSPYEIGCYP